MDTFIDYVNRQRRPGTNGNGVKNYFVPRPCLHDYWEDLQKIRDILNRYNNATPPHVIHKDYLCVFSTLVYIRQVEWLPQFLRCTLPDGHFPGTRFPSQWPEESPVHEEIWKAFLPAHWMFFPLEIGLERLLSSRQPPERVLPWVSEEELVVGDASKILKVEIPESCFRVLDSPSEKSFVLKRYSDEVHRRYYEYERDALTRLHGRSSPTAHLIGFHGSFELNGTMNLVLEYVEGGHLFDYMQQTPPPQTNKDIHALWTSIVGILKGCHHIHQWTQHPQFAETSRLVHQDLKPQNILIVKGPSSRYDFDPKVADFGCSHVLKDPQKLSPDRHGNPTYSAPECSHHAPDLFPGPDVFTPAADIFALGCILSEVAAWVAEGIDMIETYRSWRQEEIARNPHFADSAYSEGFHNGADVLQAFPMLQNYITTSCPGDLVTSEILHVVGSHMLVGRPERRSSAKEIICKLQHVLDSARDDRDDWKRPGEGSPPGVPTVVESVHTTTPPDASASPTPSNCLAPSGAEALTPTLPIYRRNPDHDTTAAPYTGQSSSSPMGIEYPTRNKSKRSKFHDFKRFSMNGSNGSLLHGRPSMPTNPSDPSSADGILTINDILQYREARKDKRDPAPGVHYLVAKLRSNLARRDHVFFVDDTQSMYTHRAELIRAFTAFSYLAKLIDRDGIELIFASNPRKIWKDSATSRLIDILERHQFVQESGMMEGKLGELVDHIVTDRLPMTIRGHQMNLLPKKEVSIFVLTDGCWHNNLPDLPNAAGVKAPIERLMRIIHDKGLNRTQVMIQFIRFGNDENGKRYLELLDDFGQDTGRDMVDTRAVDGNVYAMFIGSLSPGIDGRKDDVPSTMPGIASTPEEMF